MPDSRLCYIAVGTKLGKNSISFGRFETAGEAQTAFAPMFDKLFFTTSTDVDTIIRGFKIPILPVSIPEEPKATYEQLAQLLRDNGYQVQKINSPNQAPYAKNIQRNA